MNNKPLAVYPGTFDPLTNGHLDIIKRVSKVFTLIIAVSSDSGKSTLFTMDERVDLVKNSLFDCKNDDLSCVQVMPFEGLLVNFMRLQKSNIIIRGLRAVSDFEYEFQMACINSKLDNDLQTFFVPTATDLHFISSRFIKSVAVLGGDISNFVPPVVQRALVEKYQKIDV